MPPISTRLEFIKTRLEGLRLFSYTFSTFPCGGACAEYLRNEFNLL